MCWVCAVLLRAVGGRVETVFMFLLYPADTCRFEFRRIITQHLSSPSMWAIFPLQDLLACDESLRHPNPTEEQINNPADRYHYWKYRMHLRVEDLINNHSFSDTLQRHVTGAGRNNFYS